jgi:hypothetical protein
VTTYTYGPLNLLTGVSYNTASAPAVAATAPVSITYKSASPGKGQIDTVTDGIGICFPTPYITDLNTHVKNAVILQL